MGKEAVAAMEMAVVGTAEAEAVMAATVAED